MLFTIMVMRILTNKPAITRVYFYPADIVVWVSGHDIRVPASYNHSEGTGEIPVCILRLLHVPSFGFILQPFCHPILKSPARHRLK